MSRARKWIDEADAHMAEMQQLWNSISSPKSPAARSTPRRTTKSTLIPVAAQTPEGLERKARAKEREQKKAMELELNRKRIQEHHRNLKNMRSPWAEARQQSPAPAAANLPEPSPIPRAQQDAGSVKKSYEQQSIEFQSARRALRKSLNAATAGDIVVEFVLPKDQQQGGGTSVGIRDDDRAGSDPALLAQFGEQHDLRPVKRLLKY